MSAHAGTQDTIRMQAFQAPTRSSGRASGRHRRAEVRKTDHKVALAIFALALIGFLGLVAVSCSSGGSEEVLPTAAPAPTPVVETTLGTVSRVLAPDLVQVDTRSGSAPVRVLGVAPLLPADCGYQEALDHANDRLVGQPVTLVPDPAVDERLADGVRRAYVVLRTQQNYTDDVLLAGLMTPSAEKLSYSEVFDREAATAKDNEAGRYGEPCKVE